MGSERSAEQKHEPMDKNRMEARSTGRAALRLQSPYPSRVLGVDSAVVCGRRSYLPREVCTWSWRTGLRETERDPDAMQKSAEGVVPKGQSDHSIEALTRKGRNGRDRRTGNDLEKA